MGKLSKELEELKCNFHIRKGRIYVYPHIDPTKKSHTELIGLSFFIIILLVVVSLTGPTVSGFFIQESEPEVKIAEFKDFSMPQIGLEGQDLLEPFLDIIRIIVAPLRL